MGTLQEMVVDFIGNALHQFQKVTLVPGKDHNKKPTETDVPADALSVLQE